MRFEASSFIVSGSQIIIVLYADSKLLNDSLRIISSASLVEITPLSVLPRFSASNHSCGEK